MTERAGRLRAALGPRPLLWRAGLAATGAVAALGLAPFGLWPLALAGFAVLPAAMIAAGGPWAAALSGWAFAAGYFAHALVWIVDPFLVDPVRHGWMAPFALTFMAGGLALFWGGAFWVAHRLGRDGATRVAWLVPALALAECARAYVLTGFPWAAPAQAFVDSPALLLLAWIGPHGLDALVLATALGLGLIPFLPGARRALAAAPALALAGLSLWAGLARATPPLTQHIIRIVQANAPQDQKWDPALIPVFFDRHLSLTEDGPPPDLVLWSESAIAPVYERSGAHLQRIAAAARGAQVALGLRRYQDGRFYNALLRLDQTGAPAAIYDKHHLVPFGEYIPLGGLAKRFGIRGLAAEDGDGYSAGPGPALMDFGPLGQALPLICYEAVFPQDLNGAPGRADFILHLTNDAWFGSWSGPYQHLAQARMRAVEQGLPVLRAANTGISAVIDANGAVLSHLPLGEAGRIDSALPAPKPPTFYAKFGDKPAIALLLLLSIVGFWAQSRRRGDVSD